MQGHFPETVTEVALWLVTEAKRCNIQLKSKQLYLRYISHMTLSLKGMKYARSHLRRRHSASEGNSCLAVAVSQELSLPSSWHVLIIWP